jgi:hypothetical protein
MRLYCRSYYYRRSKSVTEIKNCLQGEPRGDLRSDTYFTLIITMTYLRIIDKISPVKYREIIISHGMHEM